MISKILITHKGIAGASKGLKSGLKLIPSGLSQQVLTVLLNRFFSPELQAGDLDFIASKPVRIEVTDLGLEFVVKLNRTRLQVVSAKSEHQVALRGDSQQLFLLSAGRVDPDTLFFRRQLSIQGDTEAALELKNLLDTIELAERIPPLLNRATQSLATELENLHQAS